MTCSGEVDSPVTRFPFSSLRTRLLLLVLIATVPAWGLIYSTAREQRRLAVVDAKADAQQVTRLVALEEERLIEGTRQLLASLARSPVRSGDPAACNAFFSETLKHYPFYANLGAIESDATISCSALPTRGRINVGDRPYFQRAIETRSFSVGDYQIGRVTGKPTINFGYPVLDKTGRVQTVVFAALELVQFDRVTAAVRLPPGALISVIDQSGTILARHPDPEKWIGRSAPETALIKTILDQRGEGTAEAVGMDGVPRLIAFTRLGGGPGGGLFVSVGIPTEVAFAGVNRIFVRNLAALGLITATALVVAWVGGNLIILRRLNTLARAAELLRSGDLSARADVRGDDEIGTMAQAFNSMAEQLTATVRAEQEATEALAERVNELAQRSRENDLLSLMGELLEACSTLEEAYAVTGRSLGQLFPDEAGTVLVMNASRNLLEPAAAWGAHPAGQDAFTPEDCWALRRGRAHLVEDTVSGLLCKHLPGTPLPSAYLCIPLLAQSETLGVLYLSSPPAPAALPAGLAESKQRLAVSVAERLAPALANLRLRESLRSQAIRDPLTGMFNRRYMEETLERELSRAQRGQYPVGVVMFDIDGLKPINDSFGHDAGDALLRELGALLRGGLRGGDIACRYGGDEFVFILPEAPLDMTQRRAEQLREAVKRLRVSHRGQIAGPVTVSGGVAGFPDHGATGAILLQAADVALYRAKDEGRDRVIVAKIGEGGS